MYLLRGVFFMGMRAMKVVLDRVNWRTLLSNLGFSIPTAREVVFGRISPLVRCECLKGG
jgi:hypothetical protein